MLASTCSGISSSRNASSGRRRGWRGHLLRAVAPGAGQQDGELVAGQAGDRSSGPSTLEARADQAQQLVAEVVAELSLTSLNRSRSSMQDGARAVAIPVVAAVDGGLELLDEATAVGQPGQRVPRAPRRPAGRAGERDRAQAGVLDDQRALERDLADGLAETGDGPRLRHRTGDDEPEQPVAGEERNADVGGEVELGDERGSSRTPSAASSTKIGSRCWQGTRQRRRRRQRRLRAGSGRPAGARRASRRGGPRRSGRRHRRGRRRCGRSRPASGRRGRAPPPPPRRRSPRRRRPAAADDVGRGEGAARCSLVRACSITPPRCAPAAAASRRTSSVNGWTRVLSSVRTPAMSGARPSGTARRRRAELRPTGEQARVLVGRRGLTGPQHALGEVHADGGVAGPVQVSTSRAVRHRPPCGARGLRARAGRCRPGPAGRARPGAGRRWPRGGPSSGAVEPTG